MTFSYVGERVPGVRCIAVLRPGALGDYVFSLPALDALRGAYPDAEIVLLGKAWQASFLDGRPGPVDRVVVLPPIAGVGAAPEHANDEAAIACFVATMRALRFDLALQLHGGGRFSNPFVARLGARVTAGLRDDGAPPLDRSIPYVGLQSERLRQLEVAALVGAPPRGLEPRIALTPADEADADAVLLPDPRPLVILQPGATDPRRRWPVASFVALADALAARGVRVAINGIGDERPLVDAIHGRMREPSIDLGGALSLGGLAAALARADLVIGSDSGPLHLAEAVGAPTLGIYWINNLVVSAPLTRTRHRGVVSWRIDCPVCGRTNLAERCAHAPSFVADVGVADVLREADRMLGTPRVDARATSAVR